PDVNRRQASVPLRRNRMHAKARARSNPASMARLRPSTARRSGEPNAQPRTEGRCANERPAANRLAADLGGQGLDGKCPDDNPRGDGGDGVSVIARLVFVAPETGHDFTEKDNDDLTHDPKLGLPVHVGPFRVCVVDDPTSEVGKVSYQAAYAFTGYTF